MFQTSVIIGNIESQWYIVILRIMYVIVVIGFTIIGQA